MEFLGCISLFIMGIVLGIMGAGGSILTIPILMYLLKIPIIKATSYSVVIVGSTAFIAAIRHKKQIFLSNSRSILFALASVIGVFITRYHIVPYLPKSLGLLSLEKALILLLILFMLLASYFMINDFTFKNNHQIKPSFNKRIKLVLIGLALGTIAGFLGAGGGFLIIPTLVVLMGFNMSQAVPTSLFIISLNSLMGFLVDKQSLNVHDWSYISKYLTFSILGMFIGLYFSKFIKNQNIKKAFGYFILTIAFTIFIKEILWQ